MGKSVGQIDLDLNINKKQYDKQLSGITSTAKKAGAVIAAAFSVKKLVDFGKQCIELGSDLSEVQNVVDVTFPKMSAQVDKFAQSAAATYGLSETMAKKFTGTFGAMAKAFGFAESQAYDMSTTLTGLAGDVASFYNISQDEAYVKLKSVFTGETESLKDLGVVMTQTALDSFALTKGFGKTVAKMTEAEKVALRYAFVQDQLATATGDFARTSDGWANQVRVLKLQFDSLKATIGQGLINVFTPVLKVINTLIGKLATLANAFKSFTELVTGNKSTGAEAEKSLSGAAGAAEALTDSTEAAGDAAKKTAKEMKGLMGFDKIQKQDSPSTDSGSSSGSGAGNIDFGSLATGETVIDKTGSSIDRLKDKLRELKELFRQGFSLEFGDSEKNFADIRENVQSIGKSVKDIFQSDEVQGAAGKWVETVTYSFGRLVGIAGKVGSSVVSNLTNGISETLEKKKDFIKKKLAGIIGIKSDVVKLKTDFAAAMGDIISGAFDSKAGKRITADVLDMLTTGVLGGAELFARAGHDLSALLIQPIVNNKDKISEAITNTLEPISTVVGTIKDAVSDAFAKIEAVYNEHIAPLFTAFKEGASDSLGKLLELYNTYVAPVLDAWAAKFQEVYENNLKPCMENIMELAGTVADYIKTRYEMFIKPIFDWLIAHLVPVLAPIVKEIGNVFMDVFGAIGKVVGGFAKTAKGLIDFIVGVFTGDWKKAWNGVKDVFKGIFDMLVGIIKTPLNAIIRGLNKLIDGLSKIKFDIPKWVPVIGGKKFGINIGKIPELAQGAYVKPNTPQLAMIGDNRHQGEVVAPEDKLREMAMQAAQAVSGGRYDEEILKVLKALLAAVLKIDPNISMDGVKLKDMIVSKINEHTTATGVCEIIT